MIKIDDEIKSLFLKAKVACGYPIRPIQVNDEQLCVLLETAIEDYAEKVQNWMIENQWATLWGKDLTVTDMAFALSVRTMDLSKDYSYWFSKEVGLQQVGPWELKQDFINIEAGKQNYIIPAGREINKVMYVTPSVTQAAMFANYGGIDIGFGGGYAQLGGGAYGPVGGFYTAPAADIAYLSTDLTYKNRLLRCDLVYKVTGGPNGTKILHLISTPGSKLSFNTGGLSLIGSHVWYNYYDSNAGDVNDLRNSIQDILLTPDQVPLTKMSYNLLNEPTKVLVRQLLQAKTKELVGIVRGTYSGKVGIPDAELMLDYQMLLNQGREEYDRTMRALEERLTRMNPVTVLENQAKIVDSNNRILNATPMGIYAI